MSISFDTILAKRLLSAVFQPIVASADLGMTGYEGLIRGPAGSQLESPAALFARARALGRQQELERLCLNVQCTRFAEHELPGKLFLNVGTGLLLDPCGTTMPLDRYLRELGADLSRIVVEITEEDAVQDYRKLRKVAGRLIDQGAMLAIDDLGSGFASLRLWLELQPDWVKLDRAFVQGVHADPVRRSFIEAVRHIARNSGARMIAEGIETAAEFATLRQLGVDYAQGFYVARPSANPPRPAAIVNPIEGKSRP